MVLLTIRPKGSFVRWILIACSAFVLFTGVGLFVIFSLKSDVSNSAIYEAYDSIKVGQSKVEIEKILSEKAPYSRIKIFEDREFTITLYKYEDKWPLKVISFARFIEIKYDQEDKVISKRPETD